MNGNWYTLYDMVKQRHREDIALAERRRLAKGDPQTRPIRLSYRRYFLRRILYALGARLMNWGCRLQSLYE